MLCADLKIINGGCLNVIYIYLARLCPNVVVLGRPVPILVPINASQANSSCPNSCPNNWPVPILVQINARALALAFARDRALCRAPGPCLGLGPVPALTRACLPGRACALGLAHSRALALGLACPFPRPSPRRPAPLALP